MLGLEKLSWAGWNNSLMVREWKICAGWWNLRYSLFPPTNQEFRLIDVRSSIRGFRSFKYSTRYCFFISSRGNGEFICLKITRIYQIEFSCRKCFFEKNIYEYYNDFAFVGRYIRRVKNSEIKLNRKFSKVVKFRRIILYTFRK